MKVQSDNIPKEMEFLQEGILVRFNIQKIQIDIVSGVRNDGDKIVPRIHYEYDEIKVGLSDTKELIISKLIHYLNDKIIFADKIIQFKNQGTK